MILSIHIFGQVNYYCFHIRTRQTLVNKSQLKCKYRLLNIFFFVQLFIIFLFYYFLRITLKLHDNIYNIYIYLNNNNVMLPYNQ